METPAIITPGYSHISAFNVSSVNLQSSPQSQARLSAGKCNIENEEMSERRVRLVCDEPLKVSIPSVMMGDPMSGTIVN